MFGLVALSRHCYFPWETDAQSRDREEEDETVSKEQQIHVIFNPISGQGDAEQDRHTIERSLIDLGHLVVHVTSAEVGSEVLAQQALEAGADIVIAAGGDGTVSGVASALVGTDTTLGILPRGTVNAFAASLNIPESLTAACELIGNGHTQQVDTARCGDRTMLLLASIGFEADLMKEIDRETKNRYGKLAILVNGLKQLRELQRFDISVDTGEDVHTFAASALVVANAATLATFLAQGPGEVDVSDGQLDATVLKPEGQWEALVSAADLFLAGLFKREAYHGQVNHFRADTLKISAEPPQNLLVDGELVGQTPVEIQCLERSLSVIVPKV